MENVIIREILDLTKDLMRFKTTRDNPQEINRCADYIEGYLKRNQMHHRRYDLNKVPSLLVMPGKKDPSLLLMSHMDVVDGPDEMFLPVIREDRLYGRGSYDDKYAVALSLVLLKNRLYSLRQKGEEAGDAGVGVLITGDEEIGGENGAKKILGDINPGFAIALDGGSLNEIIVKAKGILRLRMVSSGKTCHASRPWLGENAIEKLMDDYAVLKDFFTNRDVANWHRTLNLSTITGGKEVNQVPDQCEIILDIRYTEDDNIPELVDAIQSKVQSEVVVDMVEPLFISGKNRYLDLLLGLSSDLKTGCEHGASDARHLMRYGLTGVAWGANGNLSHHSLDEHVEIASINTLYNRLDQFVDQTRFDIKAKG
jgi:succinyl-diaminopimelate desuccinylase